MSEEILIQYAAPTLAGLKSGSLFTVAFSNQKDMHESIRRINRVLVPKGLCLLPVGRQKNRTLVYVFRPALVEKELASVQARKILARYGYHGDTVGSFLSKLIRRLREKKEFPHEIGLFLGYPPEDVQGFIENKAANCKCIGTWKVYGNEETAKKTFQLFQHCTEVYRRQWRKGTQFEKLVVSV